MALDPSAPALFRAVLGVIPAVETAGREARRIAGETGLDCLEWGGAGLDQRMKYGRRVFRFQHLKDAVVAGDVANVALVVRVVQVRHEAPAAHGGVNLEDGREYRIGQRQARASALAVVGLRRFEAIAQV